MFSQNFSYRVTGNDSEWQPRYIEIAAMLFVATLLITSILIPKLVDVGFTTVSAGLLMFPLTCALGDVITEVYGFNRTRRIILVGMLCSSLLVIATSVAIVLPPAPSFQHQEAFATLYGVLPRIVLSSFTAYFCCEIINSFIMSKMKIWSSGRYLSLRAILSTVIAQFADSIIFWVMAMAGVLDSKIIIELIITSWAVKVVYELLALPFTLWFVAFLKRLEGVEHFDRQELYVFKI